MTDIQMLADQARERYIAWVRQMLTLAVGALTVLVSFQQSLIPADARGLWMLQACWVLLALAVLVASLILHAEATDLRLLVEARLNQGSQSTRSRIQTRGADLVIQPHRLVQAARVAFPWVLASALAMLTAFAVLNANKPGQNAGEQKGQNSPSPKPARKSIAN